MSPVVDRLYRSPLRRTAVLAFLAWATLARAAPDEPLFLREPADVVVLSQGAGGEELELLPDATRVVPDPLPKSGEFRTRLLNNPTVEVEVPYAEIERIERFPQRLLRAAIEHGKQGDFGAAYDYFARLDRDFASEPGFAEAFAAALRAEAAQRFKAGEHDHALAILESLVDRAPSTPGLAEGVDAIGDKVIAARWEAGDYAGVRRAIDTLDGKFKSLRLKVLDRWSGRIEAGAARERERAEGLATAGRTREALRVVSGALALDPTSRETNDLLERLSAGDKTLWIGVWRAADPATLPTLDAPCATRQSRLVGGRVATLDRYEPTGGEFTSAVGALRSDDSRRRVTVAFGNPLDAARLARELLTPIGSARDPLSLARRLAGSVSLDPSGTVEVRLKRPHPQPVAAFTGPLPPEAAAIAPGGWRRTPTGKGSAASARYERISGSGAFNAVEEYVFDDIDAAVAALRERQIHAIDRVPPWKLRKLQTSPGVRVVQHRLPTVHALLLSPNTPLRAQREVRRAVSYAIARQETLDAAIAGGQKSDGLVALSAAMPVGLTLGDPLRYAYNDSVEPWPYEPRLAALLLSAARSADRAEREARAKAGAAGGASPGEAQRPAVPDSLRLAHAPTPVPRAACAAIKEQLDAVGFRVELVEASEADVAAGAVRYDLRYAELTIAEPLADVWALFGPGGIAGSASPAVLAGVESVLDAATGKEAADRLRDLHRAVFADLPLLPLWQTVEHSAFQDNVLGPTDAMIDLYQGIDSWRLGAAPGSAPKGRPAL